MNSFEILTDLPQNNEHFDSDMEKRYYKTCILVKKPKSNEFKVAFVNNKHDKFLYEFRIKETLYNVDIRGKDFIEAIPFLPETGYYTYNNNVIYLYKNPQRQWKRSFCSNIYIATSPANFLDHFGRIDDITWQNIAIEILNPKYQSLDKLNDNYTQVAINRSFAGIQDYDKNYHLVYRRIPIGKLDLEDKSIVDIPDVMKQEVSDMLSRNNLLHWKMK